LGDLLIMTPVKCNALCIRPDDDDDVDADARCPRVERLTNIVTGYRSNTLTRCGENPHRGTCRPNVAYVAHAVVISSNNVTLMALSDANGDV